MGTVGCGATMTLGNTGSKGTPVCLSRAFTSSPVAAVSSGGTPSCDRSAGVACAGWSMAAAAAPSAAAVAAGGDGSTMLVRFGGVSLRVRMADEVDAYACGAPSCCSGEGSGTPSLLGRSKAKALMRRAKSRAGNTEQCEVAEKTEPSSGRPIKTATALCSGNGESESE